MGRQRVPVECQARARHGPGRCARFVGGLYEGDGRPAQGAVFVIGVMHGTTDASAYKTTMKSWLGDAPFWLDMQRTVRFWAQEVYGDARRWGVPGAAPEARREYLNDFLQHAANSELSHRTRTAPLVPSSRTPTRRSGRRLAVAGRPWLDDGLGRPDAALRVVAELCASQLRLDEISARPLRVRLAPNNETGLANADSSPDGQPLDRLGIALRDSAPREARPGIQASPHSARLVPRRRGRRDLHATRGGSSPRGTSRARPASTAGW